MSEFNSNEEQNRDDPEVTLSEEFSEIKVDDPVVETLDNADGEGEFADCTEGEESVYIKSLEKAIEAKEEGNNYFRNKEYDNALESYSRAITYCPEDDENKENLATFYGNRSAAYFSLEEYELVVEDCTAALELKPDYVKVIARRMLANEKLEKFEEALTGTI